MQLVFPWDNPIRSTKDRYSPTIPIILSKMLASSASSPLHQSRENLILVHQHYVRERKDCKTLPTEGNPISLFGPCDTNCGLTLDAARDC